MTRISILFLIALAVCPSLRAQGVSTGSSSLLLPVTADGAALSEANVAAVASFSGVSANPAALAGVSSGELQMTYLQWIDGIQSQALGAVIPLRGLTVAFGITHVGVPDIEVRDVAGPALGTFTARFLSLRGSAAMNLDNELSMGMTVKYLYEKIYVDDAIGYAIDAGVDYAPDALGLRIGAAVTNLGRLGAFRNEPSDLPTAFRFGISHPLDAFGLDWTFHAAVSRDVHVSLNHFHGAVEVSYDNAVTARVGYVSGYEARGFGAGLGFRYGPARFDYTLLPLKLGLSVAQCLSVGVSF